jgi:transcriptional regulator with XRE-family HTH domain
MATTSKRAGQQMRQFRESRGLTMRDVYDLTGQIAKALKNPDYIVSPSRLSDIESEGKTPNLFRLHALSLAYNCKVEKLLKFYGIGDGRPGGSRGSQRR